jgi:transcriptional regulator with XRE-family HTH domain
MRGWPRIWQTGSMDNTDEMATAFGEFLRAQRKLANISQRQLGRMSGVSDSYLSQMERGMYRPSPEIMKSLAKAFNMAPSVLYAQFGLLDHESDPQEVSVEEAIRRDDHLQEDHKQALLVLYRTLAQRGPRS